MSRPHDRDTALQCWIRKDVARSQGAPRTRPSASRRRLRSHDTAHAGGARPPHGCIAATLKKSGWPPVFAFVFDEFWTVWRMPHWSNYQRRARPGYRLRPTFTVLRHSQRGAKGWPPHADGFGQPGVSVWIPLSDATIERCIYVVPKDLIAGRVQVGDLFGAADLPLSTVTDLLQCARALPARAGSVLLWNFDVIHWGAVVQGGSQPRISVSAEFVPAAYGVSADDVERWHRPRSTTVPPFLDRLGVIASNIRMFAANDPWTFKFLDLGTRTTAI